MTELQMFQSNLLCASPDDSCIQCWRYVHHTEAMRIQHFSTNKDKQLVAQCSCEIKWRSEVARVHFFG